MVVLVEEDRLIVVWLLLCAGSFVSDVLVREVCNGILCGWFEDWVECGFVVSTLGELFVEGSCFVVNVTGGCA